MRTFDRGVDIASADDATLTRELEYTMERVRESTYEMGVDPRMATVRAIIDEQTRRANGQDPARHRAIRREQLMSVMTLTEDLAAVIPDYAPQLRGLGNAFWMEVAARVWLERYRKP